MPATVTLATTTLSEAVDAASGRIKVASTAGLAYGTHLYIGGELMKVMRLEVDPWVFVSRGVGSSRAAPHHAEETIYIGRADQFYSGPPVGSPDGAIAVSPYIDVENAKVYFAQGNPVTDAPGNVRWWQEQTLTRVAGPLGSKTTTLDPTAST